MAFVTCQAHGHVARCVCGSSFLGFGQMLSSPSPPPCIKIFHCYLRNSNVRWLMLWNLQFWRKNIVLLLRKYSILPTHTVSLGNITENTSYRSLLISSSSWQVSSHKFLLHKSAKRRSFPTSGLQFLVYLTVSQPAPADGELWGPSNWIHRFSFLVRYEPGKVYRTKSNDGYEPRWLKKYKKKDIPTCTLCNHTQVVIYGIVK